MALKKLYLRDLAWFIFLPNLQLCKIYNQDKELLYEGLLIDCNLFNNLLIGFWTSDNYLCFMIKDY